MVGGLAFQYREKAFSRKRRLSFRWFSGSDFRKRWKKVGHVGERVGFLSGRHGPRTTDNQRDANSVFRQLRLASGYGVTGDATGDAAARAIIGGEDNISFAFESRVLDGVDKSANLFVRVLNHCAVFFHFGRRAEFVGSRDERPVRERHGKVNEHRVVAMLADEIDQEVGKLFWAKLIPVGSAFPGREKVRVPIPFAAWRIAGFVPGPHAILVKASVHHRFGLLAEIVDFATCQPPHWCSPRDEVGARCSDSFSGQSCSLHPTVERPNDSPSRVGMGIGQ